VLEPRLSATLALAALISIAGPAAGARRRDAPAAARTGTKTGTKTGAASRGLGAEVAAQLGGELASDKDEVATAAAKRLGELGGEGAVEALSAGLALGLRPGVAAEALTSLGKIHDSRSAPVVILWAGNANPKVRLAAVKAAGKLSDPKVVDVLLERLGDGEAPVRAAAAEALAARKEGRAEKRLFQLVSRNDAGAAGPLGEVMAPDAVPRLAELHGRVDDGVLATSFGEFLKRTDVPDRLRVDVVRTVARLQGAAATAALVEYLASVPERDSRPSKEEAQKVIDQRGTK
jgi:HEAT repeat protein